MVSEKHHLRYNIIIFLVVIVSLSILFQLGRIMLPGNTSAQNRLANGTVERGPIYDRNGRILAVQTEQPVLSAWIPSIRSLENTADLVSRILPIDAEELLRRFQNNDGYMVIKRNLNPAEAEALTLLIQQGELRGLTIEEANRRYYPQGQLASHVLGFTGLDNYGLEGIELTQNSILAPSDQRLGNHVYLTLDSTVQYQAELLARAAYEEHDAESVMLLIASAKTGEILGWASTPTFDPNFITDSTLEQRRNRPIQFMYEPGSVFKIFSLAAIMNMGGIHENTVFQTAGGYAPPGINPPITDLSNYGNLTAEGIIQFSSNVGAALASDTVNAADFHYVLRQFGFGERTGIPLNGEQLGILRETRNWSNRSKPTIAIGQEIGVTALQMVRSSTVFGNNGVLLQTHIVKRIVSPTGDLLFEAERTPIRQVLSPTTTQKMLGFMNTAADFGTGQRARVEGLNISIKTGTAEMVDPETGRYSRERFLASSLALFPTENPEIIVYVVIEYPKREIFGGRIAAPIIRQAAEFLIPYYGIQRSQDQVVVQDQRLRIVEPPLPGISTTIPSFQGLSLRTILPLLDHSTVTVTIEGDRGWVYEQSLTPGTPVQPGMQLILRVSDDHEYFPLQGRPEHE